MNKWIKESISIANSRGYLDKIFKVYPIEIGAVRDVPDIIKKEIKKAFHKKDYLSLVGELLNLSRFPIDDPYIASLRKHPCLLKKNPKTIERIGRRLLSMGLDDVLELASKPKSPSRQFGNSFKKWIEARKYLFLDRDRFKNYDGTAFLKGSDDKLKQFVAEELKVRRLPRRPDFVLKINDKFIIGEAKFLTDYGGTQNNQFDGALKMTKINNMKITGVAVLDGIVWFESKSYMHRTIKRLNKIALSALLLNDFIKEQRFLC